MVRPWASGSSSSGDDDDLEPSSSADDSSGDLPEPFPRLDPPWPDGEVDYADGDFDIVWPDEDDEDGLATDVPLSPGLGPSWVDPPPCRGPRRQSRPGRPVHRRRSRHSFEPQDLTDDQLDLLLRGTPPAGLHAVAAPSTPRRWSAWVVALAFVTGALLVLGVVRASAGHSTETITTRTDPPAPVPAAHTRTPPTSISPPTPSAGATPLPPRVAEVEVTACTPTTTATPTPDEPCD